MSYRLHPRFSVSSVFVALSVFCQNVPSIGCSRIQFSYVPPSFPRTCSITAWHSHLSISLLYSVYHIVSLFFALILKFKYLQITIGSAFSILFQYSLSEFHLLLTSFLWPFAISPNYYLFFFHQFYSPIKDESSSLSVCSKCSWRTTRSHPPCSSPSQVLHYNTEKEQSQGLHDVLTSDSPVVLKNLKFWNPRQHREADHFPFTSACNEEDPGSIYWVGKIPGRRAWQPTPVFLPGEFHGQRSLVDFSPWGHKESDTTEWFSHFHTHRKYISWWQTETVAGASGRYRSVTVHCVMFIATRI